MATQPDDEHSSVTPESFSTESVDFEPEAIDAFVKESDLLGWVARRFRFDPDNRHSSQPMVRTLQQELSKHGEKIAPDGILGRQTIEAINRLGPRLWPVGVTAEAASTDFGIKGTAGTTQQKRTEEPATEPESTGPSTSDQASARPVALSDSAISDISQDRLGFTPYVEAVAEFILAEQTRPPLAIAINAHWGQGKTSFMNMLDAQLKRLAPQTTTRVATTWFNPWKYSDPEQVWAAFVANVTRCLQDNLSPPQRRRFKWDRFKQKWDHHGDLALKLRLTVAFLFVLLVLTLPFTLDLPAFHGAFKDKEGILGAFYAATKSLDGWLWWLLFVPFALLSVLYGYIALTTNLGLNLLEYVEKTDFKDKIGTLSQFEHEMRRLADAVPKDLKVVVFIDDLDRCKGKVLGEIIEALQLADVSRACIFIMGMDLQLVAQAIERDRAELAQSAGSGHQMEHGSGYKFLEKIIQARLSLPAHGMAEMSNLIKEAMISNPTKTRRGIESDLGIVTAPKGIGESLEENRLRLDRGHNEPKVVPSDSDSLIRTAEHYGSRHFNNPRQLKRFINGFRLQTYLAAAVRPQATPLDRLARFLVLAEKWPGVVDYMLNNELGSLGLRPGKAGSATSDFIDELGQLAKGERDRLVELLDGERNREDCLEADEWRDLADWCGFTYYRSIEPKKP